MNILSKAKQSPTHKKMDSVCFNFKIWFTKYNLFLLDSMIHQKEKKDANQPILRSKMIQYSKRNTLYPHIIGGSIFYMREVSIALY